MPKGLGALSNLQVLKGFIIGDFKDKKSCTINNLTKLSKLRKLSISISTKEFPIALQLHLQRLKFLQKLKISWPGCILRGKTKQRDLKLPLSLELPSSLQKLELEGFPEIDTPGWLLSHNLENLKKLYIRGGLLCNLGIIVATTVEMLQLKYLSNLEMPWKDIMMLFPNLIYMEKVECPSLDSFSCD
ncbi:disease resistance RPP13-like protein 4 [Camellia sinensis]|uniref:disease resistance RPP13-like protein 4 n=1 Tax=Camellia sinensis TaxID=4442 RepID=UPI001035CA23|nr:disease resistance RPP13-like protein 4 [Camellia sinensis]